MATSIGTQGLDAFDQALEVGQSATECPLQFFVSAMRIAPEIEDDVDDCIEVRVYVECGGPARTGLFYFGSGPTYYGRKLPLGDIVFATNFSQAYCNQCFVFLRHTCPGIAGTMLLSIT